MGWGIERGSLQIFKYCRRNYVLHYTVHTMYCTVCTMLKHETEADTGANIKAETGTETGRDTVGQILIIPEDREGDILG